MKDYNNGRLLFCHIRPDYNAAIHDPIQQSGFHDTRFQVLDRVYEESKEDRISEDIKEEENEDENGEVKAEKVVEVVANDLLLE